MADRSAPARDDTALTRVRVLCLALPESSERLSHGHPAFFVEGKRTFAMYLDNHHGDGRLALWCAAPEEMQQLLVQADPERFFVPPYVGHRGWIGVRLDLGADWEEIAGFVEDAYLSVAPKRLTDSIGLEQDPGLSAMSSGPREAASPRPRR